MIPWFQSENSRVALYHGDCLETLLFVENVDAVVTDPPYGLKFMGKNWDHGVPGVAYWQAIQAACKPGAHLLAFGGTRTFHRLACAIEDAGWEIRDTIGWLYGSGFPKSLNVSKAIDKEKGIDRNYAPHTRIDTGFRFQSGGTESNPPTTDEAKQWDGWGTALKPAWEPIILARKPIEGTVAENVQKYGCGALNIDGCRVPVTDRKGYDANMACHTRYAEGREKVGGYEGGWKVNPESIQNKGARWPANILHDGSDEVLAVFPSSAGAAAPVKGTEPSANHKSCYSQRDRVPGTFFADTGSASRFFYCAKASKQDRDEGCEGLDVKHVTCRPQSDDEEDRTIQELLHGRKARNFHPTVKPTDLMRYLCRLITPPGGLILDPFMGSGSTGKAAMCEQFRFVGMDLEAEYLEIAKARILNEMKQCALL